MKDVIGWMIFAIAEFALAYVAACILKVDIGPISGNLIIKFGEKRVEIEAFVELVCMLAKMIAASSVMVNGSKQLVRNMDVHYPWD